MPQTDPNKKLYDAISERNLYSKSYEDFKSQFGTPEKVGKLYNSLRKQQLVSIPQEEFQNKYFGDFFSDSEEKLSSESNRTAEQETPNNIPSERDETAENANMSVTEDSGETGGNEGLFSGFSATNSGYSGMANQVGEFINSTLRAGMQGFGNAIESVGTLSDQARERFGNLTPRLQVGEGEEAEKSIFTNIGREIEETAKELFPDNPDVQNNFVNTTVPEALGSTMSFVASQAAGGTPLTIINGGLQMGQSAFEDAKIQGASDDEAMEAFYWNMPLGGLEAFPAAKLLNRFNKATGGSLTRTLKEGAVGGVEEMMQESTQQFLSNVAAQNIYDESRDLIEGVGEGGAAGFVVGAMLNSIGASARGLRDSPDASPEAKADAEKTLELVEQKKEELDAVDPLSDQTPTDQQVSNPFLEELNFGVSGQQRQAQQGVSPEQVAPTNGDLQTEQQTEQDFDEAQAEEAESIRQPDDAATEGTRERGAFTTQEEKGNLDEQFVEEFKERGERLYKPLPDDATIEDANNFVEEVGVENAKRSVINDDNGLLPRHRVAIGHKILAELDKDFKNLQSANDPKAQAKLDEQIDFANRLYKLGTELGRGVRAFAYHSRFSPEAHVRTYERVINKAKEEGQDVEFDQEVAREILRRGKEAEQMTDQRSREEATIDLMAYISQQTPASKIDIALSIGYAHLLSGWETHAVNISSTAINTSLEAFTLASGNPQYAKYILPGLYNGFIKGMPEAWRIIKTGKVTGTRRKAKLEEIPDALEIIPFKSFKESDSVTDKAKKAAKNIPIGYANTLKFVRRFMAAEDILFFKSAEEFRARTIAHKVARKEGISDRKKLNARVNEILGNTAVSRKQAKKQAEEEGFTGSRKILRINDIIQESRSNEIISESAQWGLKSTFNQKPQGALGIAAEYINKFTNKVPVAKTQVPFTHVVANVFNMMLDYTPVGLVRLRNWGPKKYQLRDAPEVGTELWKQQAAKTFYGTLAMGIAGYMNMKNIDDDNEDRDFMITGRGPKDYRKAYQLQETGWEPNSVKAGDTYYSYQDTPLGFMLSLVGNYHDAVKYGNLREEDLMRRVSFVLDKAPQAALDMTFLTGMSDMFTAVSRGRWTGDYAGMKTVLEKGRAFAIPNLIKQVDQIFDPKVYTSDDIEEALIRDIPVARTLKGSPIINVLGEPIRQDYDIRERLTDRFLSVQKSDPVWRMIVNKEAFISHPLQGQTKITLPDGTQRAMEPDEHYNYIKISGKRIKRDIQMNLTRLRYMPKKDAQETINKFVRNRRRQAKNTIEQRLTGKEKVN